MSAFRISYYTCKMPRPQRHNGAAFFSPRPAGTEGTAVTVAKDAQVISEREGTRSNCISAPGSTHQYDPRYPDRYNVTTFGENDLAVDISGSIASPKNTSLTVSERPFPLFSRIAARLA